MIQSAEDPEAEMERIWSAALFENNMGIPIEDAYNNLDVLTEQFVGKEKPAKKSMFKAIADRSEVAALSKQLGAGGKLVSTGTKAVLKK